MKIIVKQFQKNLYEASVLNEDIINGGELFIGREEDCHIKLDSFQVSRHHAVISLKESKLQINVMSSFGGVRVNGNEVTSGFLSENDKIEIGEFEIVIQDLPSIEADEHALQNIENIMPEELEDDLNQQVEEAKEEGVLTEGGEISDDLLDATILDEGDLLAGEELLDDAELVGDDLDSGGELVDDLSPSNDEFDNENLLSEETQAYEENELNELSESADNQENFDEGFESSEDDAFSDNSFGDNDNFGNDDFGDSGFGGDEGSEATQVLQSFAKYSLKLFGEFAPFDRYSIEQNEIFIGRDPEKCQIILEDPEVSKVHAKIKKTMINCILEDLDSANGIIYNGERVNKAELSNGDEFIIGDTSFTVSISSDIIEAEKDILMPVEENQEVEIEEIIEEEVDFDGFEGDSEFGDEGDDGKKKSLLEQIKSDPKKKRIAIIVGVLLAIVLLLPDDEPSVEPPISNKKQVTKKKNDKEKKKYSPEILEKLEQNYALARAKFEEGKYDEAKEYIDIVMSVDPSFKNSPTLSKLIQEGLDQLIKQKEAEAAEKERRERQRKIADLLVKAKEAVKERNVPSAENYFNMINELDPENIDVPPLRIELEGWVAEQKRIKQEKELTRARRQNKVDQLAPGKTLYLKGEWFQAIDKLEKFLKAKDMDEDLIQEATSMLKDSQKNLLLIINPLLSKARSFKEGEDLKQSYESYGEVLKYDPSNEEALNERDSIFVTLQNRSRKVYREALVAESLSLFGKAKEKFQEVQQISPINSDYYNKATDKLKNYLE